MYNLHKIRSLSMLQGHSPCKRQRHSGFIKASGLLLTIVSFQCVLSLLTQIHAAEPIGTHLEKNVMFLIGGYGKGISLSSFDIESENFSKPKMLADVKNASYLAKHPRLPIVYAVRETMRKDANNGDAALLAFGWDSDAQKLTKINQLPIDGDIPCHLSLDEAGRFIFVANYTSGSIFTFETNADGSLKKVVQSIQHRGVSQATKQSGPRAHCIRVDATGKWVLCADLGMDKVLVYRFDRETGLLTEPADSFLASRPGAGPRHFAFHPSGKFIFVINELDSTLTTAAWDSASGKLTEVSTLPTISSKPLNNYSTAAVYVSNDGRFVYGSNRGHDSIACFSFDASTNTTKFLATESTGGKTPRDFRISPDGKFVFAENQGSNSIVLMKRNADSGLLKNTDRSIEVEAPSTILFLE